MPSTIADLKSTLCPTLCICCMQTIDPSACPKCLLCAFENVTRGIACERLINRAAHSHDPSFTVALQNDDLFSVTEYRDVGVVRHDDNLPSLFSLSKHRN